MLLSLALILIGGFILGEGFHRLKLPRFLGMLAVGILLGPYVFDLIDPNLQAISSELRLMALIIILMRAGLALNIQDLKAMGAPAVRLAFIPASFEILMIVLLAPPSLGLSLL
jgi:NhaP-type Na+/H+ or K+/H+ antiporter